MATELRVPKIGMGMAEGKLVEWHAADGEVVKEGAIIYSRETDKTVNEIEAPASGVLRIVAPADEIYEIGVLIGTIE
jgi:pyruvate/2-oxoglutarate dehydrogenase complex dihydrolipoamide acyltransferase (E2) component